MWELTQQIEWLGLLWNSRTGTLSLVHRCVHKISNSIEDIINASFIVSARTLASFVGQTISTGAVIGSIARILTRHCSMSVASADRWDKVFQLDIYCIKEIMFWKKNICTMNARDCFLGREPKRFVYSDACETGCGATVTLNDDHVCHKLWDETERSQSSIWRELAAIRFALEAFTELLHHSRVKWYTDNRQLPK